ncbi:MAG TPA: hypothetical protein DEB73_03500, partial [Candidatus Magasanikbacteria bacterium]|nr:hypothetical protein [Candidatus Magasanikbacteria bacterium]
LTQSTSCGVGACASTGTETCTAGIWGDDTCEPGTVDTESCNNIDDDCNGQIDEDLTQSTSCGVGACFGNTGFTTCVAGAYVNDTCDSLSGATAESCNGLDDDCDEAVDEDFPLLSDDCDGGDSDECENGTYTCKLDGLGVECVNEEPEGFPGYEEVCDDEDNDCDGVIDEDDVCSSCNNPLDDLVCGQTFLGATGDVSWLDGYSCKSTLNESGNEAVFVFNSDMSGLSVMVKPINLDPATADLDVFVLSSCSASSCLKYGNTSATWSPTADTDYFVVVDGYKGASGEFDLQVTCKETNCSDGLDNDSDDATDCADSDCVGKVVCL